LVASNELFQESGIMGKLLSDKPIDLIRWNFPGRIKNDIEYPAISCFDIAFLFMINENQKIKPNKKEVSNPKWIKLEEWRDYYDEKNEVVRANPSEQEYNQRTFKKIKMYQSSLGKIK
jgi:isopentenyldiphosphate isomerase